MAANDGTVLVTGATGVLGREVLAQARAVGLPVRAVTRRTGVADEPGVTWVTADLQTGAGLDAAFDGVGTVIHCASDTRRPKHDIPGWHHLLDAAERAGVGHIVNISIVGIDRIPFSYYKIKLAGERLLADSGIPWTNLRATQFPALLDRAFSALAKLPVVFVPSGTPCQPVDPAEVAARLVALAQGAPVGEAPELGGPRTYSADDLARTWLRAAGKKRRVVALRLPGKTAAAFRTGALTTSAPDPGTHTWEEYLGTTFG